ncbi:bifunctional folylpolyglutamate synthase/dihydrofolate synthase [Myxococcota bacterium]|nr:bifunctional folylpolyglutamate synthase/dihydrofolate synthase [Myxococcota bacterium]
MSLGSDRARGPGKLMDGPGALPPDASERYRALLERLFALAKTGMHLGLGPISRVLTDLGHPELAFDSVHVAGSNGKGSTAAFTAAILGAAGEKVGLYTSPHLVSLTERVQVVEAARSREITPDALVDAVEKVESVARDFADLSFFEVMTAAGMVALEREDVSWGVIEAGLGARLDATRLVDAKVSVLTDLTLEHTEILGDTLEAIAAEKVFVARPGRPLVAANTTPGATRVVEEAAQEIGAPVSWLGRDFDVTAEPDGTFSFDLGDRKLACIRLSLLGPHQGRNAALAVKAATLAVPTISDDAIRRGLERAYWPGRMEVFRPDGDIAPILLDGAHNPQGAEILARALTTNRALFTPPLHFVFGVLGDKDVRPMFASLAPLAETITLTRPGSPRARAPGELVAMLPASARSRATVVEGVAEAVAAARVRASHDGGWVVVSGSLYLVGDVRAWLLSLRRD